MFTIFWVAFFTFTDIWYALTCYVSDKGEILRHTKKLRSVDVVLNRLADLEQKYSELLKLLDSQK